MAPTSTEWRRLAAAQLSDIDYNNADAEDQNESLAEDFIRVKPVDRRLC
jgi:hypothetical protein